MRWKPRGVTLVSLLVGVLWAMVPARSLAQVGTTLVADTIYRADGTPATGTVIVSWQPFTTSAGSTVPAGTVSSTVATGGALSLHLAPNAGATPMGSYYTAVFHLDDGSVSREYWVVPVSTAAVSVGSIRSSVLPTSVAMQTVSKSYVDTAIAVAISGHPLDSSPYVLKAGDTMTGALVLPADPVAAGQAADKHYVDVSVAAVSGGLGQKVSTMPTATQTVAQPVGTQLQVNNLNGVEYASQYLTGLGNNGIANAVSSPDCASGCEVKVEQTNPSGETYLPATWNYETHVKDARLGGQRDSFLNPVNLITPGQDAAQTIDLVSTRSAQQVDAAGGATATVLLVTHEGLAGGSNLFPSSIDTAVPYFKSTYSALNLQGTYNTLGQHVLAPNKIECFGVGDCLAGSHFIVGSGGYRDEADEGTHPFDLDVREDGRVFQGTCGAGCTAGSTSVTITPTAFPSTQGEGRFLIDKNPAGVITTGTLTGAGSGTPYPGAVFSGTSFPVSVFFETSQAATSQSNNVAPGTVTVALATTGVPAGYATNTAAAPAGGGVACVADATPSGTYRPPNYEMATYTVVDGTHLRLTLNKAHGVLSTVAIGGLCGYGLEQTVDTSAGVRQVFPVVGSTSATTLYYAGAATPIVGLTGSTSAYLNVNLAVAAIARSGNVVSLTTAGNFPVDVNGLTLTIAGVTDSSYNGSFAVTTTGPNTLTFSQTGANSTSTGGTLSMVTGGFALYPMAEVLSVFNPATKSVDGQMTLAANTVAWASGDVVEEPHYFQERVSADVEVISQTTPRPIAFDSAGKSYQGNVGPGIRGWAITNDVAAANYLGNGGTHSAPDFAFQAGGVWRTTMDAQAGERSVFSVHCNSHGCGKWNSTYNLFELDSSAGTDSVSFAPTTSALTFNLRGTSYGFTPSGFNAGTINVGVLNATTIHASVDTSNLSGGTVATALLPVIGASGPGHAAGVAPDPGATAGTTRFLREDGTWAAPAGSGTAGATLVAYGDSHPAGLGLNPITRAYPYLLASFRNWTPSDLAVSGDTFMDLYLRTNWATRTIGPNSVTMLNEGSNDVTNISIAEGGGIAAPNANHAALFAAEYRAWMAWNGSADTQKVLASDCTLAGSWNPLSNAIAGVANTSMYSSTAGDTITCTVSGTRLDALGYAINGGVGSYTITVDGTTVVCPYPAGTTACSNHMDLAGNNGGVVGLIDTPVRGLGAGSHTLVLTVTNGTGGISFVGVVGTAAGSPHPLVVASRPSRFGSCASNYANHGDTVVAAFAAIEASEDTNLLADGFNLVTVDYSTSSWWDPSVAATRQADCIHPNYLGNIEIANAYQAALVAAGR